MMLDLLQDPDCPDCKTRGYTYRIFGRSPCLRCAARHISREPPQFAHYYGERLRKQMTDEQHAEFIELVRTERRLDNEAMRNAQATEST
jgi:hypothetical protein